TLRVVLPDVPTGDEVPQSVSRLDTFHRSLMDEFARRWGVQIQYIPVADANQALEYVATGQADLAIGVQPNWDWDERVDFTGPYLLHGLRLMVKKNSNIFGFEELRGGKYVAFPTQHPELERVAIDKATEVNAVIRTFGSR